MSHIDSVNREVCAQLLRLCYSVNTLCRLHTLTLGKLSFGCYCITYNNILCLQVSCPVNRVNIGSGFQEFDSVRVHVTKAVLIII